MRKDDLILSLWMLLVLLMLLSSCNERKEDFQPKSVVKWGTVKETITQKQDTEEKKEMELQCHYKMDANGNLIKVYKKEP